MPPPRGGQGEGAGFGRVFSAGDDGEVERDQNGQGLSTATAAVSHQLILWSLRNLAGLPDLDGVTVAVVISYPSPKSDLFLAAGDAQLYEGDDRQHDEEEHGVWRSGRRTLATGQATLPR